jgi:hypothetical protein
MGNKNQIIETEEIFNLFENMSENTKLEEIKKVLKKYDADNNGYLDKEEYSILSKEFLKKIKDYKTPKNKEEIIMKRFYLKLSSFEQIDVGNDGKIIAEDILNFKNIKNQIKEELEKEEIVQKENLKIFENEYKNYNETLLILNKIDLLKKEDEKMIDEYINSLFVLHDASKNDIIDEDEVILLSKIFKGHSDFRLNSYGQEQRKIFYLKLSNDFLFEGSEISKEKFISLFKDFIKKNFFG